METAQNASAASQREAKAFDNETTGDMNISTKLVLAWAIFGFQCQQFGGGLTHRS